jgi:hypothetical protein
MNHDKTMLDDCDYLRALCKSQRKVIESMAVEQESYREEIRCLRITLGLLDAVSMKAEEVKHRRER